jgi:hypothetical protein
MFGDRERQAGSSPVRYQVEIISGELRTNTHQGKIQEALNEGSSRGWRLVSATTAYSDSCFTTGIYWDTAPER